MVYIYRCWCWPGGATLIHGMGVFSLLWLGCVGFDGSPGVKAFQRGQGHLLVMAGRVGQRRFVRWSWIYLADCELGEWCESLLGRVCSGR